MLARLDSVLVLLCMIIAASLVQSAHISSNITRTDADFDGADREYSYDSAPIEAEESYAQRMCSRSRNAYVENRMDCNRFFVCAQDDDQPPSKPLVGVCPPGMWFDPYHSDDEVLCVFPEVLCATDHTDAYSYCNCSATFAAHAGSDADQDALIESSTECIVDNQLHLYESKRDCERYFACYNEKVFRMQCKPGMHFNVRKGYCDTPEATDCVVRAHCQTVICYMVN